MMRAAIFALAASLALPVFAQDVRITSEISSVELSLRGKNISLVRAQDEEAELPQEFRRVARACPPHCLTPLLAADGVETLGELELIAFLRGGISEGSTLLMDVRDPTAFGQHHIPGAVNMPASTVTPSNPFRDDLLRAMGAEKKQETWSFENVLSLVIYDDGPWNDLAGQTIRDLIAAGYPTQKLHYYRGGLQMWLLFGFNTFPS